MIGKMEFIIESGWIFTYQSALQVAAFMNSSTHFITTALFCTKVLFTIIDLIDPNLIDYTKISH